MTEQTELIELYKLNLIPHSVCRVLLSVELKTVADVRSYVESGHDLTKLKGIGKTKYESLKHLLCLGETFLSNEPAHDYDINTTKEELIEFLFDKYYRQFLNVRLNNLRDNNKLNHKHLLPLIGKPRLAYNSLFPGNNKGSLDLLYEFCESVFKQKYEYYDSLSVDELFVEKYGWIYPFLIYRERCFVRDFIKEYNYPPSFYILYRYLKSSTEELPVIFSKHYGIYDGNEYSKDFLADLYGKVPERIRQIYTKKIEDYVDLKRLLDNGYINFDVYSSILNQPYLIMEESDSWAELKNRECLNRANNPEFLLRLLPQYSPMKFKRSILKELIYVKKEYESIIYDWYNGICNVVFKQFTEDIQFQINIDNIFSDDLYVLFKDLLIRILSTNFGVEEFENDYFVIYQNNVDVEVEVIKILEETGVPMPLSEIFDNFRKRIEIKELSSKTKCDSQDKLRIIINLSDIIKSCGNTSTYALSYWDDVYFGNQREKVEELLNNSDAPMKFEYLFEQIVALFPATNEKSLRSSLIDKDKNRFVKFNGDFYGLREKKYSTNYTLMVPVKKTFDEHLCDLKEFISKYERFPYDRSYFSDEERSLCRWYQRVLSGDRDVSQEQLDNLNHFLQSIDYNTIPKYVNDYKYKNMCEDLFDFVKENQRFPNTINEEERKLWEFFCKSKREYLSFEDFKYIQFKKLCKIFKDSGFDTGIVFDE